MSELTCGYCGEVIGVGADYSEATDDAMSNGADYNDDGELLCADCHSAGDTAWN